MIDAQTISSHAKPPPDAPYDTIPVRMTFVDWVPAIISTRAYRPTTERRCTDRRRAVGFIVTSLLDKSHLHSYGSDAWGGEGSVAWRARVVLFIGVALMAGGLAGSLVRGGRWGVVEESWGNGQARQTVLILKYVVPGYDQYVYYGGANVAMNAGVMFR